ncbi:MAG TPA: GNAT family N-acetyltransferase [Bacteroidia bacterium]|nr:GNAT family N-acetyltransferase [Bacteroidia bacterium]
MKLPSFRLTTERLLIRSFVPDDAEQLYRMVTNEKESLRDYFPLTVENTYSLSATRKFVRWREEETKAGKSLFAGIFTADKAQLIGQLTVKDINWRVPKCELGYFIVASERGKGFAPEALVSATEFCFSKAGMVKLLLRIEQTNRASIQVAGKCGYTCSGTLRNDFRGADGRLMDCEIWEKIN